MASSFVPVEFLSSYWVIPFTTEHGVCVVCPQIMETLLQVMARTRTGTGVHEEAMLAVGTFTLAVNADFEKYLQNFIPFVRAGLQDHLQWQVCMSTVGVLGDVCRAVSSALWPYCDELVSIVLANLGSPNVHRNIKPELLTLLGDMALNVEGKFAKYLDAVLVILRQAMAMSIQMVSSLGKFQDPLRVILR